MDISASVVCIYAVKFLEHPLLVLRRGTQRHMGSVSCCRSVARKEFPLGSTSSSECVRFGDFELRADTGELWKNGTRRKLQQKPFQILQALLEQPGALVTRDELRRRLWLDGTFVDFESGLNTAMNRLRAALGDSKETPQFVETLPRLGYRLICPVTKVHANSMADQPIASAAVTPVLPAVDAGNISQSGRFNTAVVFIAAAAAILALLYACNKPNVDVVHPNFRQLTFQSGLITDAKFVRGSQQVSYTARWQQGARKTYLLNLEDPSSYKEFKLKPISNTTAPAGWSPEPQSSALVRSQGAESVIEFPAGSAVYTTKGWVTNLRVSPYGNQAAFLEHPVRDDDGGYLRVVDRQGRTSVWTPFWSSAAGLAWSPDGNEVWFTASTEGANRALYASSGPGNMRLISRSPSSLRLLDISNKGQILAALDDVRMSLRAGLPGKAAEWDLSKFDCSHVDDISPDGRFILFTEGSGPAGKHYSSYLHDLSSGTTVRLAQGRGLSLSPDAARIIIIDPEDRRSLVIHQRGGGTSQTIYGNGFEYQWAKFLPGSRELLVGGAYPGRSLNIYRQALNNGTLQPVNSIPYMDNVVISTDGGMLAGTVNNQTNIFSLQADSIRKVLPMIRVLPAAWSRDGQSLYGAQLNEKSVELIKVDVGTGQMEPWKSIPTESIAGFAGLASVVAAPEAGIYAYSAHMILSKLYAVDGWR